MQEDWTIFLDHLRCNKTGIHIIIILILQLEKLSLGAVE